ncbi:MAG: hypothetical protein GX096_10955 [Clostridiales bacterium]|nr:hypothetical protein [Clostridiales bacterium]
MTIYQILCLIGVPSFIAGLIGYILKKLKDNSKETEAVRLGVQALLRAQMIADWIHYSEKGDAPIYARDNFENCWKQYHGLGQNGVMDSIHTKFMALPTDS